MNISATQACSGVLPLSHPTLLPKSEREKEEKLLTAKNKECDLHVNRISIEAIAKGQYEIALRLLTLYPGMSNRLELLSNIPHQAITNTFVSWIKDEAIADMLVLLYSLPECHPLIALPKTEATPPPSAIYTVKKCRKLLMAHYSDTLQRRLALTKGCLIVRGRLPKPLSEKIAGDILSVTSNPTTKTKRLQKILKKLKLPHMAQRISYPSLYCQCIKSIAHKTPLNEDSEKILSEIQRALDAMPEFQIEVIADNTTALCKLIKDKIPQRESILHRVKCIACQIQLHLE